MTRRDYIAIARLLGEEIGEAIRAEHSEQQMPEDREESIRRIARKLEGIFAADNPRFNADWFRVAIEAVAATGPEAVRR